MSPTPLVRGFLCRGFKGKAGYEDGAFGANIYDFKG
jgi:hypothetical protein